MYFNVQVKSMVSATSEFQTAEKNQFCIIFISIDPRRVVKNRAPVTNKSLEKKENPPISGSPLSLLMCSHRPP